jgi:hypothetical protein
MMRSIRFLLTVPGPETVLERRREIFYGKVICKRC